MLLLKISVNCENLGKNWVLLIYLDAEAGDAEQEDLMMALEFAIEEV